MYLTLSKRFEFSTSLRYWHPGWDEKRNRGVYGDKARGQYGHGYNPVAYFVFHGPIDKSTGMVINVTDIKREINRILADRYDHKFINTDHPEFTDRAPTAERLAAQLLQDAAAAFRDHAAAPVVCHYQESPETGATAYENGRIERHFMTEFSAARRTCSPHLSDEENQRLFGVASAATGHGHGYRLRVTLQGEPDESSGLIVPEPDAIAAMEAVQAEFDHKNLNSDVPGLAGVPITTEGMAQYIADKLGESLPVARVRLHENSWFFAEFDRHTNAHAMGIHGAFHAAHRLHSPTLSTNENLSIYEKCNNPAGHGHRYEVEATIGGQFDQRSGTLYPLNQALESVHGTLREWDRVHLNREVAVFKDVITSGENIVSQLWPKLAPKLDDRLVRLRLWETPNNRFTLRRQP